MEQHSKNNFQIACDVISFCVSVAWSQKRDFFLYKIVQVTADILLPFISLILKPLIIDELITTRRIEYIIGYTVSMVFLEMIIGRISSYSRLQSEKYESIFSNFLEKELVAKSMKMDYELTEEKEILDQLQRAKNGIGGWSGGIAGIINPMTDIIKNVIVILGVLFILLKKGPLLVFLSVIGMILEGVISKKIIKVNTFLYKRQAALERIFGYTMFELVDFKNAKDIRLYDAKDMMLNKTGHEIDRMVLLEKERVNKIQPWNIAETVAFWSSQICIYIYLGVRTIKRRITIGEFSQLLDSTDKLGNSLISMLNSVQGILQKASYFNEYITFMNILSKDENGEKEISDSDHIIEFKNVSFKYPHSDRYVLKNVSIKIRPREHLSIVGLNGAGKTTFIKLLCRLYDVSDGEILLDNVNIKEYDIKEYLQILSVVFQDFKLYSFSVKDNITLGKTVSDNTVLSQCELVGIKEKIDSLKNGLDTVLFKDFDKNGIELSGGQQQKIAIARAALKDSQIVIMDEPTAALDPIAEYEIYSKMNEIIRGKTAIFVSHRLSSCVFSDYIAVFHNGNIIEYGNHKELMELGGKYAELFNAQAKYYMDKAG